MHDRQLLFSHVHVNIQFLLVPSLDKIQTVKVLFHPCNFLFPLPGAGSLPGHQADIDLYF